MTSTELAPRRTLGGTIAVWVSAAIASIAIGLFVPRDQQPAWLLVAAGGSLLLSFAVQLSYGHAHRFIQRVAGSALGALIIMGAISLGFGLAALVPG